MVRLSVPAAMCLLLAVPVGALRNEEELATLVAQVSNVSASLAQRGHEGSKGRRFDVMCKNFCFACEDGTPWEIHRAQSLGTKLAKVVGGTLAIAAIAGGLGPIVALFGAGAVAVAGVAGGAHLAIELHKEAPFCPEVKFTRESETEPSSLTLDELNMQELLLLDTQKFGKESTKWAVACNYMILATSKWQAHGDAKGADAGTVLPRLEAEVIETCGKWLCSGAAVQHDSEFKCGGSWWKKTMRFFR